MRGRNHECRASPTTCDATASRERPRVGQVDGLVKRVKSTIITFGKRLKELNLGTTPELCATSMVTTIHALQIQLNAHACSKKGQIKFLKDQFHARVSGATPRNYPSLGKEVRSKFGKLKLSSGCPKQSNLEYLSTLIEAMIVGRWPQG